MNIIVTSIFLDAFFIVILAWCAYTDIRTRTVPNQAIVLLLCLGLVHTVLIGLSGNAWWLYPTGVVLVVPFFIVWLRGGMGAGDVKLVMGIGLYLGVMSTLIAFAFMVPVLIGLMVRSWLKAKTLKSAIPFAPVLALGTGGVILVSYVVMILG